MVTVWIMPSESHRWIRVSASANSARRWRQPPQGVHAAIFSAITATSRDATAAGHDHAPIAVVSAHQPSG